MDIQARFAVVQSEDCSETNEVHVGVWIVTIHVAVVVIHTKCADASFKD